MQYNQLMYIVYAGASEIVLPVHILIIYIYNLYNTYIYIFCK